MEGGGLPEQDGSFSMGDDLAPGSWQLLSQFSPQIYQPKSPLKCLFLSAVPLPEPRVSGCKLTFMHWLSKRLSASPAVCAWQRETLPLFSIRCYLDLVLLGLWYGRLGKPAWGLDPTFLWGIPPATKIFFQHFQLMPMGAHSALSSALYTSDIVVKLFLLSVHGYKSSLLLLFNCLFWISPQFSYNSRLVLGGG